MSLHLRIRYALAGGHVHCRLFTGPDVDHLALAGELNERVESWVAFRRALPTADFVCDDDDATRETYDTILTGVLVTTVDLDTGETETMELAEDTYVLTLGARMELTHEQRSPTTGSVGLTLKRRPYVEVDMVPR